MALESEQLCSTVDADIAVPISGDRLVTSSELDRLPTACLPEEGTTSTTVAIVALGPNPASRSEVTWSLAKDVLIAHVHTVDECLCAFPDEAYQAGPLPHAAAFAVRVSSVTRLEVRRTTLDLRGPNGCGQCPEND